MSNSTVSYALHITANTIVKAVYQGIATGGECCSTHAVAVAIAGPSSSALEIVSHTKLPISDKMPFVLAISCYNLDFSQLKLSFGPLTSIQCLRD